MKCATLDGRLVLAQTLPVAGTTDGLSTIFGL